MNGNENKRLALLGSTGSIGVQSCDVARSLGLPVTVLAAKSNIKLLEEQIREFSPKLAAVTDEKKAKELKIAVADTATKVVSGHEGLIEAAVYSESDIVLNSVVGMIGLEPTLAAIKTGKKRIALANKETIVAGGMLVTEAARTHGTEIIPVDSEHSAIFQCLQGVPDKSAVKKIILTASGGPFFGMKREQLAEITPAEALKHPNWSMGAKITIDSSTLMNKGLEVIEAAWLFSKKAEEIEVVVHRESIIHSAIELIDNAVIAQLGTPDMRIPIQYAISYPARAVSPAKPLNLFDVGRMTFFPPDEDTFTCLRTCKRALSRGGLAPAAANGANEAAVGLFLEGKISFLQIGDMVGAAMENQPDVSSYTLADVLAADTAAREYVLSTVKK
ncbi:MAG: 1-deoxy-D-xylulose-5-phosphate reductoisomerase [Oscillospiraceae bacterium]|jgi:1-deoxy-D-xylulose-5-phosphate reductoisomerase|nr:1-deoxy-D-xylulose-5-phosphate reductoisomerase [Oscillospiraceae bacterium]